MNFLPAENSEVGILASRVKYEFADLVAFNQIGL